MGGSNFVGDIMGKNMFQYICKNDMRDCRMQILCTHRKRFVFYNSKNLNCIGALSFLRLEEEYWRSPFYDSKRSIGEVPFLINFIGVIFEAGKETRGKIWKDFEAEQKLRAERKDSFVHTAVFERARS